MANWCGYYNCWCSDVEGIIEYEDIECELDCKDCDEREVIKYGPDI